MKEKFNQTLAETKKELEKIRRVFLEDSSLFDSTLVHFNELGSNCF